MPFKFSYVLVGLFVVLLGAAGIGISMWLAFGDFDKDYQPYRVYIKESVSGLYIDAPVKYRGVEVGKVREIVLDPDNPEWVRVTMDIEHEVPIKQNTHAILSVQGLTGIGFIELTGGTRDSPMLVAKPGEEYPVMQSGPSLFVRMDAAISELIANLNQFTEEARSLLRPELWESVNRSLNNIETFTATLAERTDSLGASIGHAETLLANSARASAGLPELVDRISQTTVAVEGMATEIRRAGGELSRAARQSGDSLAGFGEETLPAIDKLVEELRGLVATLERASQRIEEDPRAILYGSELRVPGPGE